MSWHSRMPKGMTRRGRPDDAVAVGAGDRGSAVESETAALGRTCSLRKPTLSGRIVCLQRTAPAAQHLLPGTPNAPSRCDPGVNDDCFILTAVDPHSGHVTVRSRGSTWCSPRAAENRTTQSSSEQTLSGLGRLPLGAVNGLSRSAISGGESSADVYTDHVSRPVRISYLPRSDVGVEPLLSTASTSDCRS